MNPLRLLSRLLTLRRFCRRCFFCRRARLTLGRGSTADLTHFDCPRCGREYEKERHGRLRQRWRTPLKEALFLASQSTGSLGNLSQIQGPWRESVVEEVERELAKPSMRLTELFHYATPRGESEIRAYLRQCVTTRTAATQQAEETEQDSADRRHRDRRGPDRRQSDRRTPDEAAVPDEEVEPVERAPETAGVLEQ